MVSLVTSPHPDNVPGPPSVPCSLKPGVIHEAHKRQRYSHPSPGKFQGSGDAPRNQLIPRYTTFSTWPHPIEQPQVTGAPSRGGPPSLESALSLSATRGASCSHECLQGSCLLDRDAEALRFNLVAPVSKHMGSIPQQDGRS